MGQRGAPQSPRAVQVRAKIPTDQPMVVRISPRRFVAWIGGAVAVVVLLVAGALAALLIGLGSAGADRMTITFVAAVAVIFIVGLPTAMVAFRAYQAFGRGPVLAAGPDGLWARRQGLSFAPAAIWLPWDLIDAVSVKRAPFERMVQIVPRAALLPAGGPVGPSTRLLVSTLFVDRPVDEIMNGLATFAGRRARVTTAGLN